MTQNAVSLSLEYTVTCAQAGERAALEAVVRAIQPDIHGLALRFLACPHDAEDASQEILIRVLTHLSTFRGDSAFRTWVYRIACNVLIGLRKQRLEHLHLDFDRFAEDLVEGLSEPGSDGADPVADSLLLEEVKIGCTLAMLQCLDREHRLAYILGEIMELDHKQAAEALDIRPPAYRKRLSRARADIVSFMQGYCGLVDADNACRCRRRVGAAIAVGRVDSEQLYFAGSAGKHKAERAAQRPGRFPCPRVGDRRRADLPQGVCKVQRTPSVIVVVGDRRETVWMPWHPPAQRGQQTRDGAGRRRQRSALREARTGLEPVRVSPRRHSLLAASQTISRVTGTDPATGSRPACNGTLPVAPGAARTGAV